MKLSIITLSENTAGSPDLLAEWGLSIYLEVDGLSILFDTGQSISAAFNAGLLGIDLKKVNKIILSHGHRDHTGGLEWVLTEVGKEVEVIAHPDIWKPKYRCGKGAKEKYIGIPFERLRLESLGACFSLSREPKKITDNIITSGEIPMVTDFEVLPSYLCVKENDRLIQDSLFDDQALIITTRLGLVVILGCGHHGLINTLYHAQKLTGVEKIHMVLGGCHLVSASEEQILCTINALRELKVERIGVSHCTGMRASFLMAQEFGDSFFYNNTGTKVEVP